MKERELHWRGSSLVDESRADSCDRLREREGGGRLFVLPVSVDVI